MLFADRQKEKNLKFYLSFVYIIAIIINSHNEFKRSFNTEGVQDIGVKTIAYIS